MTTLLRLTRSLLLTLAATPMLLTIAGTLVALMLCESQDSTGYTISLGAGLCALLLVPATLLLALADAAQDALDSRAIRAL